MSELRFNLNNIEPKTGEGTTCYAKYIFMDVVRFSEKTAEVRSTIVNTLNIIVLDCVKESGIPNNDDSRIFIPTGDGICVAIIINQPYDIHLRIALSILSKLNKHNIDQEEKFEIRVGINEHTDEGIIRDINGNKNIAGAGIILAQRIMDKADGNQILVSKGVFDTLNDHALYRGLFDRYNTKDKHGTELEIYLYRGKKQDMLNVSIPSALNKSQVKKGLDELEERLNTWKSHLIRNSTDDTQSRLLEAAWNELIQLYLNRENSGLSKRSISATSEIYTQLNRKLTDYLYEKVLEMSDTVLCRFHITGMLPEQFFNGPQIESLDSSPIIFCHAFEGPGYKDHHEAKKDLSLKLLQIKRCLVVRDDKAPDHFRALSHVRNLDEQSDLKIYPVEEQYPLSELTEDGPEARAYLKRLFHHARTVIQDEKESERVNRLSLRRIVNYNKYNYHRIAKASDIKDSDSGHEDLIGYFKEHYGPNIYSVCTTDIDGRNIELKEYFRAGGWPEIILFGFLSGSDQKSLEDNPDLEKWAKKVDWKVGIKSHYVQLTRQMEINLLGPEGARRFRDTSSELLKKAKDLK